MRNEIAKLQEGVCGSSGPQCQWAEEFHVRAAIVSWEGAVGGACSNCCARGRQGGVGQGLLPQRRMHCCHLV